MDHLSIGISKHKSFGLFLFESPFYCSSLLSMIFLFPIFLSFVWIELFWFLWEMERKERNEKVCCHSGQSPPTRDSSFFYHKLWFPEANYYMWIFFSISCWFFFFLTSKNLLSRFIIHILRTKKVEIVRWPFRWKSFFSAIDCSCLLPIRNRKKYRCVHCCFCCDCRRQFRFFISI